MGEDGVREKQMMKTTSLQRLGDEDKKIWVKTTNSLYPLLCPSLWSQLQKGQGICQNERRMGCYPILEIIFVSILHMLLTDLQIII